MMGIGSNNWKAIVGNFLIIFGSQAAFRLDEALTAAKFPTELEICKIISSSLVATLIFYGYNKLAQKPPAEETA